MTGESLNSYRKRKAGHADDGLCAGKMHYRVMCNETTGCILIPKCPGQDRPLTPEPMLSDYLKAIDTNADVLRFIAGHKGWC